MDSQLTVGGIWGGAGAGLLGAQEAGFRPIFNYDDRNFVHTDTIERNFKDIKFFNDISKVPLNLLSANLIIGSPDCKTFSNLSTKKVKENREITSKTFNNDFCRFIDIMCNLIKPNGFILENVPNITNHLDFHSYNYNGERYFKIEGVKTGEISQSFKGYYIQTIILNSYDFNVAQKRKRFFLIGSQLPILPFNPSSLSNDTMIALEQMRHGSTVGEAFDDIPEGDFNNEKPKHSSIREKGFKNLKPGKSYYNTQNNRRLYYDKPSWTVASSCSRFVHPYEPRTLSVRETARLMGWPDTFKFYGTSTQQLDQVGKSIVPQIITAISFFLKEQIYNNDQRRKSN